MMLMIFVLLLFIAVPVAHKMAAKTMNEKKVLVVKCFGDIDELFKRRNELIPPILGAVSPELREEKDLINEIVALRSQALAAQLSDDDKIAIDGKLCQALSRLMAAAGRNQNLGAHQNFQKLRTALDFMEREMAALRQKYNAAAGEYNTALKAFPTSIIASLMDMQPRKLFGPASQR